MRRLRRRAPGTRTRPAVRRVAPWGRIVYIATGDDRYHPLLAHASTRTTGGIADGPELLVSLDLPRCGECEILYRETHADEYR